MADIFVSYAREDISRVKPLVAALEGEGFSVWWDTEISPGDRFDDLIDDEIQASKCVVVVWTEASVSSRWVKNEALEGMDRDILVPVLMDPVRVPVAFKQSQLADFTSWPESIDTEQYERFVRSVSSKVTESPVAEINLTGVASMNARGGRRFRRKRDIAVPLLSLAVLTLAIFLGIQYLQTDQGSPEMAILSVTSFSPGVGDDSDFYAASLTRELQRRLDDHDEIELIQSSSFWDINPLPTESSEIIDTVDYVLTGVVRADNDLLEIEVLLKDPDQSRPIWDKTYTIPGDDFLATQDRIILSVLSELRLASNTNETPTRLVTRDKAAYRDYLIGQDLMRRGEESYLTQAIGRFQQALQKDPDFSLALASECRANLELFRLSKDAAAYERGQDSCARLLSLDDRGTEANLAIAELYEAGGELAMAKTYLLKVLEIAPKDPDANISLAKILVQEDDMLRAQSFFEAAVSFHPTYWRAHNELGSFYFRSAMYHQAIESYLRVTELVTYNFTAYSNLGAARLYVGDFEGATEAWQQATVLDPNAASLSNMGTALYYDNRVSEAIEKYLAAVELSPNDHRLWGNLAEVLASQPEKSTESVDAYKKATELAEALLAVNRDDAYTLSRLAVYYAALDNDDKSREMMARADQLAGHDLNILYDSAIAWQLMGQHQKAIDIKTKALEAGYPEVLMNADPILNQL